MKGGKTKHRTILAVASLNAGQHRLTEGRRRFSDRSHQADTRSNQEQVRLGNQPGKNPSRGELTYPHDVKSSSLDTDSSEQQTERTAESDHPNLEECRRNPRRARSIREADGAHQISPI